MYVCVWICAHTSTGVHESQEKSFLSLEAELQVVRSFTWVMESELGSLASAGLALNNAAIFPVLFHFILLLCVYMYHTHSMYKGQRTTLRSWSSPSTFTRILGIELRLPD